MTMATRLRGMLVVLRAIPGQRRMPYRAPDEIARLRDERVRDVVRYAAEWVPHYRELFRREGIDPREIRSAADLETLPLLEKMTVQQDPERFRAQNRLGRDALVFRTAGSTGVPVTVYRDRRSTLENIAHAERERVVEAALCGRRYGYSAAVIIPLSGNYATVRTFYGRASFRPFRPSHHWLSLADGPAVHAEALARIRPLVLRGYGTAIELLFRTAASRGWLLHRPAVVAYGGDAMTEEGRRLIEDDFGIPVVSRYSSAEAFRLGFMCEQRDSYHLYDDLTHVSVVDAEGDRLPDGKRGEIVVSDLVNRGMVLLNYRLGDVGRIGARGCACGRTSRRLTELEGRVESIMTLGDGTTVHPRLLEHVIHRRREVLRFRLEQLEPDRFELLLVTPDEGAYRRIMLELVQELASRLGGAKVTAERRDELPPSEAGKFRPFVALPRRPDRAAAGRSAL
jgi:phenylacetate-CoA ligase